MQLHCVSIVNSARLIGPWSSVNPIEPVGVRSVYQHNLGWCVDAGDGEYAGLVDNAGCSELDPTKGKRIRDGVRGFIRVVRSDIPWGRNVVLSRGQGCRQEREHGEHQFVDERDRVGDHEIDQKQTAED